MALVVLLRAHGASGSVSQITEVQMIDLETKNGGSPDAEEGTAVPEQNVSVKIQGSGR